MMTLRISENMVTRSSVKPSASQVGSLRWPPNNRPLTLRIPHNSTAHSAFTASPPQDVDLNLGAKSRESLWVSAPSFQMTTVCVSPVDHCRGTSNPSTLSPSRTARSHQPHQQQQQRGQEVQCNRRPSWSRGVLHESKRKRRAIRMTQTSARGPSLSFRSTSFPHDADDTEGDSLRDTAVALSSLQFVAATRLTAFAGILSRGEDSRGVLYRQASSPPVEDQGNVSQAESACPETYLLSLLEKRGWATKIISTAEAGYHVPPTAKQVKDYEAKPFLSDLVRRGDLDGLQNALDAGRGMDASNKFGESVVHVACRRGNLGMLRFLLEHGGSLTCCDDLGRSPLHEVCWAIEPRFDIVRLFLERQRHVFGVETARGGIEEATGASFKKDESSWRVASAPNLLLLTDKRGSTPLRYIKANSWSQWRAFLDEVADDFWPYLRDPEQAAGRDTACLKNDVLP